MLKLKFMGKKRFLYVFLGFLLGIFLVYLSGFGGYSLFLRREMVQSPLPDFLSLLTNNQVSTLNLWLPSMGLFKNKDEKLIAPEISAKAALVYDLTSNKTLFTKDAKKRLPIASLTKIMTAIISIENAKEGNTYIVSKEDLVGEDSMGLSEGEALSLEELLYGLILLSGNDAGETLANNYLGGRKNFIKAMDNKAKSLGLLDTHFTNPTGLEGDGSQYSTAYDLLVIVKFAMQFPLFQRVASTFNYYIPKTPTHKEFFLENETNLLTSYPGVRGIKTGYTPEAGLTLVTYLEYDKRKIIGVILGSDNRREEMRMLLDYSLKVQGITPPPHG